MRFKAGLYFMKDIIICALMLAAAPAAAGTAGPDCGTARRTNAMDGSFSVAVPQDWSPASARGAKVLLRRKALGEYGVPQYIEFERLAGQAGARQALDSFIAEYNTAGRCREEAPYSLVSASTLREGWPTAYYFTPKCRLQRLFFSDGKDTYTADCTDHTDTCKAAAASVGPPEGGACGAAPKNGLLPAGVCAALNSYSDTVGTWLMVLILGIIGVPFIMVFYCLSGVFDVCLVAAGLPALGIGWLLGRKRWARVVLYALLFIPALFFSWDIPGVTDAFRKAPGGELCLSVLKGFFSAALTYAGIFIGAKLRAWYDRNKRGQAPGGMPQ